MFKRIRKVGERKVYFFLLYNKSTLIRKGLFDKFKFEHSKLKRLGFLLGITNNIAWVYFVCFFNGTFSTFPKTIF